MSVGNTDNHSTGTPRSSSEDSIHSRSRGDIVLPRPAPSRCRRRYPIPNPTPTHDGLPQVLRNQESSLGQVPWWPPLLSACASS
jgi:hypothetical protein